MFCSSCGNELAEGVAFCSACGAKVGETMSPVVASAPAAESQGNPLQELVESLTTDQCSIESSEGVYVIHWKDPAHSTNLTIEDFDIDSNALVETFDIAATPRILSDIHDAVTDAARGMAGFSGSIYLCDLDDCDFIVIAPGDKGDFPAYGIAATSYVASDFSASTNGITVQRLEGFRLGKKSKVSGLAGIAFGIARDKNEKAAQWGEVFDMAKQFKKEMRGGKHQAWADSVQSLVHTALSAEAFNVSVERAADYLMGDLNV